MSDAEVSLPSGLALPGYAPMGDAVRGDTERWPTLSPRGLARLENLRHHPHAPAWTHACGDLLTSADHDTLTTWAEGLSRPADSEAANGIPPGWLLVELDRLRTVVPFLRRLGVREWADVPVIGRADLARSIADFVPTDVTLDRVVQGTSSGSTGSALVIPWHPVDIAKDLPLIDHLLSACGVVWPTDPNRVGLLSVVDQAQAFTYASVMTARAEQAMARVSLHDSAWPSDGDRREFLCAADPQVVSGSALSLLSYAALDLPVRPLALVSGAVELSRPARSHLEARLGAPVIDLYGLRETGPVASEATAGQGHLLVPRRVFVEVVDGAGWSVVDGVPGEVVVSALENPYLPLLRYRTGDRGALVGTGRERRLVGLEGREAVRFVTGSGRFVQSVELTQQLQRHGIRAWTVEQGAAGAVVGRVVGGDSAGARQALTRLLDQAVDLVPLARAADLGPGKPRRFHSEASGGRFPEGG